MCIRLGFSWNARTFARPKQLTNQLDFSCLADEIAEQRPDMNIEGTAFTVGEKSINTWLGNSGQKSYYSCEYNICTIRW